MTPVEIADALDQATRQGAEVDTPEFSRYIVLSDTLARQIAADLRDYAAHVIEFERDEVVFRRRIEYPLA